MMWPSSQASKILSGLLLGTAVYCVCMDALLWLRIRGFSVDVFEMEATASNATGATPALPSHVGPLYAHVAWVPCTVNPLCSPTVKGLMVDHVNHYIYGPLCSMLDIALGISERWLMVTPNAISLSHVLVAMLGAKLLTSARLAERRGGVLLFQLRMFLDDLDGHVARERQHVRGERSEVGSLGFWVDGLCDLTGVVAMMAALLLYLRSHPPRRGYRGTPLAALPYHQLNEIDCSEDVQKERSTDVGISYNTKVTLQRVVRAIALFSGQMLLSSLAWNRYIDIYQELLENCAECDPLRRAGIFTSGIFFLATGLWRIVNPHSYLHVLSLAVFCDKTWCFLTAVQYGGYLLLAGVVAASECLLGYSERFVLSGLHVR